MPATAGLEATGGSGAFAGTAAVVGGAVWPDPADVRLGVVYGPTGVEYTGTLVPGADADGIAAAVWAYAGRTLTGMAECNVKQVNDVPLAGAGVPGADPWRPAA